MAVLAAILPVVATSSSLSLEIYRVAAREQDKTARHLVRAAKVVNQFALSLKQIGAMIKQDDQLPSHEAIGVLEDVIDQAQHILHRVASATAMVEAELQAHQVGEHSTHQPPTAIAELDYLSAHLEALCATLSVQLQTLFTAQSIMWSKLRPTISPQQTERAVANERLQLQSLIIDQQFLILTAAKGFADGTSRTNGRLTREADPSQGPVASDGKDIPIPVQLHRYQEKYLITLDLLSSHEAGWLPVVSSIASSQTDHLLEHWTNLSKFDDRLRDAEQEDQRQRCQERQPTVESDTEDEEGTTAKAARDAARRNRPESSRPLFDDANTAVSDRTYDSDAPLSPVESPRNSSLEQPKTASPRSSTGSVPVEAAATLVEAKEEGEDTDLEIPWKLCARKYYWKFIDAKQVGGNTDQSPSLAFLERNSWTEILASWVCKEAIEEAGLRFAPVQNDRKDGRQPRFGTLFVIEKPLRFDQIQYLVERTVEIYRRNTLPTSSVPQTRRASFNQPHLKMGAIDRHHTPVPQNTHPPLDRHTTAFLTPLPGPPPLVRSTSNPGPNSIPSLPPSPPSNQPIPPYPSFPNLQTPTTSSAQLPHPPNNPQSPRYIMQPQQQQQQQQHQKQPNYPQSPSQYNNSYPPNPTPAPPSLPIYHPTYPHQQQLQHHHQPYLPPPCHSHPNINNDTSTSDCESTSRNTQRSRWSPHRLSTHRRAHDEYRDEPQTHRERVKEKDRYRDRDRGRERERRKRGRTRKAAGALLGVGGLTALLDGLGGL